MELELQLQRSEQLRAQESQHGSSVVQAAAEKLREIEKLKLDLEKDRDATVHQSPNQVARYQPEIEHLKQQIADLHSAVNPHSRPSTPRVHPEAHGPTLSGLPPRSWMQRPLSTTQTAIIHTPPSLPQLVLSPRLDGITVQQIVSPRLEAAPMQLRSPQAPVVRPKLKSCPRAAK